MEHALRNAPKNKIPEWLRNRPLRRRRTINGYASTNDVENQCSPDQSGSATGVTSSPVRRDSKALQNVVTTPILAAENAKVETAAQEDSPAEAEQQKVSGEPAPPRTLGQDFLGLLKPAKDVVKNAIEPETPSMAQANGDTQLPVASSELDDLRDKVEKSFQDFGKIWKAIRAPVPTQTGDGTALTPKPDDSLEEDIKDVIRDIGSLGIKDIKSLVKAKESFLLHQPLNDRKYYMEALIQAAARLPNDILGGGITEDFVTALWSDLSHPPQTPLGQQYEFRQPDGSGNSLLYPQIGASGMPYARTVKPTTLQAGNMPDPGVLFDSIMARDHPTKHPNRISSMMFYLASIVVHDLFKTKHGDTSISSTSSYLDLAPLYGSTWEEQKTMRTSKDGKIKPDCFSETRLLSFPPGVGALLICFNRYHNYVVEQLRLINEGGRFTDQGKKVDRYGEKDLDKLDDDLFQTGRLITCGLYVNCILIDYVRTILNLNRTDENWQLNPRIDIPNGPPMGIGNQVSAEFNLVYRWHAATSEKDDKWTQDLWQQLWPNTKPRDISEKDFINVLTKMEIEAVGVDPQARPWPAHKSEQAKYERRQGGPYDGMFKDDDLAEILTEGIEDCANAMGPRAVPTVMRAIEILGIQQARTWNVATLNEFRKHFALEPHRKFSDITKDPHVAEQLMRLYNHPDNVELYPGLVVEDAKEPRTPGSGLCPGFTVSRAVLSDAVALVRGDRYYTTSYSTASLTNWGYSEANYDLTIDNGCVFYKLFLRALPNNFQPNSVYVHYPLTIPDEMQRVLTDLNKADKYDFSRPEPIVQPQIIFGYAAATQIMNDQEKYHVTWGKAMEFLMGKTGGNFMLAGDNPINAKSRVLMEKALYMGGSSRTEPVGPVCNEKWLKEVKTFYAETTAKLLKEKAYKLAGTNQVDIIRDIGNLVHVHFVAELFSLPLKTTDSPRGIFSEDQLYLIMAAVFTCVFFDVDPPKSFPLRQQARDATQALGQLVQMQVAAVKATGRLADALSDAMRPAGSLMRDYGIHMISRLCEADASVADITWSNIMGTAGGMVANQGQLFGQAMDFFLCTPEGRARLTEVAALAARDDDEQADEQILHYFMEATRLYGESGVLRWVVASDSVTDRLTGQEHHFTPGQKVMIDLRAASRDPEAFPLPDTFDPTRPLDKYIHLGWGPHACLGRPMTMVANAMVLKAVARLRNVRAATVSTGATSGPDTVKKVVREFEPGDAKSMPESWHYHEYLTQGWEQYFPFPTTLRVNWDD